MSSDGLQRTLPEKDHIPIFDADKTLKGNPKFGPLSMLKGTWVNYNPDNVPCKRGFHTTSVPAAGTNSESMPGKFRFLFDDYTEELTFEVVDDKVRNRGGTNEQMVGAVQYNQQIWKLQDNKKGDLIHVENGMYLYLRDTSIHPVDEDAMKKDLMKPDLKIGHRGETFLPMHSIARSGTIPHGSTVQMIGVDYEPKQGSPQWPRGLATWDDDHLSIHPSMAVMIPGEQPIGPNNLDEKAPSWVFSVDLEIPSARAYIQRIFDNKQYPYTVRPDLRLRDAIEGQNIKQYTFIDLGTRYEAGPQGGVLNTPMVKKYCDVTEARMRLWIETVIDKETGEEILQLQYEQISFFEFSFFVDGSLTRWPHIQVNTLRQKEWVDKKKAVVSS